MPEPDIETFNIQFERFGHQLYKAGRPYNHYVETIKFFDWEEAEDSKAHAASMGSGLCLAQV